jgi:hypothetical protein
VVTHKGDTLLGYTYDEGPGFCQATFLGIYDSTQKYLKGRGGEITRTSGGHILAVYKMQYYKDGDREILSGTVQPKSALFEFLSFGPKSRIVLQKENDDRDTVIAARPDAPQKDRPALPEKTTADSTPKVMVDSSKRLPSVTDEKKARSFKQIQHIDTDADTVKIALYDNAEVDGDSVSVFFDDAVILDRYMISDKAKELTIVIPKDGQAHTLDLFAHNLGDIPPNTALIIITAGNKRYELRASYDLLTNARITISNNQRKL